jgi:hypothetical protein
MARPRKLSPPKVGRLDSHAVSSALDGRTAERLYS